MRWARSPLHVVCAGIGAVAGVVVAVTLHGWGWSFPGVLLAFGVSFVVVGWALPEAIVGPRRLARVAFVLLPAAAGVGGFVLAGLLWGPTWPALLVGGLGGSALGGSLQRGLFPELARENEARWLGDGAAGGLRAGPDDWIPTWRDLVLAIIVAGAFMTLVVLHAAWFAYAITAVVAVGLFLTSAIAGWRRRQPDHHRWRSESLGDGWRRP